MSEAHLARLEALQAEASATIERGDDASELLRMLSLELNREDHERRSTRRELRARRDELRAMISRIDGELSSSDRPLPSAASTRSAGSSAKPPRSTSSVAALALSDRPPSAASNRSAATSTKPPRSTSSAVGVAISDRPPPSAASSRSSVPSNAARGTASQLELKPPVINPTEIVPAHIVEKFRAEFRAKQEAERLLAQQQREQYAQATAAAADRS